MSGHADRRRARETRAAAFGAWRGIREAVFETRGASCFFNFFGFCFRSLQAGSGAFRGVAEQSPTYLVTSAYRVTGPMGSGPSAP